MCLTILKCSVLAAGNSRDDDEEAEIVVQLFELKVNLVAALLGDVDESPHR